MATPQAELLIPPPKVAGMKILDPKLFDKEVEVPVMVLKNGKPSIILPHIKQYLLKLEKFRNVKNIDGGVTEFYLKTPNITLQDDKSKTLDYEIILKKITIKYDNYPIDKIFEAVLPKENDGFASFTKVGHIAHVNLREHLLPFKDFIGAVLLSKVPNCKTVVNKIDNIDNTYRNFKMELLAGEDNMITKLKENGCSFELDFSTVYWNSRLSTEHERIVQRISPLQDVLFDVFAGIGPFAVPVAKKKCKTYANDLNPESYKWLNHNFKINNVKKEFYETFNLDGGCFIKTIVKKELPQYLKRNQQVYIVMNLPALAVDFLKNFKGLLNGEDLEDFRPPIVIFYCFAKGQDPEQITKDLIYHHMGDIKDKIIETFRVRTVSNFKEMMRVAFYLDKTILFEENISKRKLEEEITKPTKKCNYGEEHQEEIKQHI